MLRVKLSLRQLPNQFGPHNQRRRPVWLVCMHDGIGQHRPIGRKFIINPVGRQPLLRHARLGAHEVNTDVPFKVGALDQFPAPASAAGLLDFLQTFQGGEQHGPISTQLDKIIGGPPLGQMYAAAQDDGDIALIGVDSLHVDRVKHDRLIGIRQCRGLHFWLAGARCPTGLRGGIGRARLCCRRLRVAQGDGLLI